MLKQQGWWAEIRTVTGNSPCLWWTGPRTGVLSPFLEPLERTFDDDLGLGRP